VFSAGFVERDRRYTPPATSATSTTIPTGKSTFQRELDPPAAAAAPANDEDEDKDGEEDADDDKDGAKAG
jgi:hypothetical protein